MVAGRPRETRRSAAPTSTRIALWSISGPRLEFSKPAWTIASHASAASTNVADDARLPRCGVTPRASRRSPTSGLRTSAVSDRPARTRPSSTAAPTCPVAPVRKTRIGERPFYSNIPDAIIVEERDDPVFAHLEHRAELARGHRRRRARAFDQVARLHVLGGGVAQDRARREQPARSIRDHRAV